MSTELNRYPNEEAMRIKLPFRGLVLGPSGSRKSNITMNLIKGVGIWDKVIILSSDLEPYQKYIECMHNHRFILVANSTADLPPLDSFSPMENTLLIVNGGVIDQQIPTMLSQFFLRGRMLGISTIFTSLSYIDTPKLIRETCGYVFIKSIVNETDQARIFKGCVFGATIEEFKAKYQLTQTGDVCDFFLIDRITSDPRFRLRNRFAPIE